ncbi:hypothetical protein SBA4_3690011 [Candidatus Sulfopaludibacter sp. SbA4]|nr:hypothetical protein SBA4_3690011 [Candidatus Sulfopaludibacter sp. SbA4]
MHVGLERSHSLVGPILHGFARVVGTLQGMHLHERSAAALQVRSGDVHLGPGHAAGIDHGFDLQVSERLHAAAGACGSDSAGQIEARKTEGLFAVNGDSLARGIEQMLVHAHESRDDGVAGQVHALGAGGDRSGGGAAHGGDFAVIDDDGLIFGGRRSGAVDDPHVDERDHRGIGGDEGPRAGEQFAGRLLRGERRSRQRPEENRAHLTILSLREGEIRRGSPEHGKNAPEERVGRQGRHLGNLKRGPNEAELPLTIPHIAPRHAAAPR